MRVKEEMPRVPKNEALDMKDDVESDPQGGPSDGGAEDDTPKERRSDQTLPDQETGPQNGRNMPDATRDEEEKGKQ